MNVEARFWYDCRWSSSIDNKFINHFLSVRKAVPECRTYDVKKFNRKYLKNIFGDSVIVVVYDDNTPIAVRGFWRNNLGCKTAFQPVDTCVIKEYRRLGIFREMTRIALEKAGHDALIYNFPNINSYPGYLKMGWRLVKQYRPVLFRSIYKYRSEHEIPIDDKYVEWWLGNTSNFSVLEKSNAYFLTKKMNKPFFYLVIGEISQKAARKFPKRNSLNTLNLFYSEKLSCYNKKIIPLNIISLGETSVNIPIWKGDYLS
jgi:hypothetical protein